jgi:hypothetical protein
LISAFSETSPAGLFPCSLGAALSCGGGLRCSKGEELMPIRIFHCSVLFLLVVIPSTFIFSQDQPPVSDPKAVALAAQAIAALTNGVAVSDLTLNGNATWTAGLDKETGSVTLQAKGTGESRIDFRLSGGARTEIRNDATGFPQGELIASDGTVQPWPQHNCWINASWFFPTLSILAASSDPSVIFGYVGLETRNTGSVQHIRAYRYVPAKRPAMVAVIQSLSTEDIYLDSASLLPVAFSFNSHPEDDEATNVLIEVDFFDYQPVNGVLVPMHVQRLINGGLALDVAVTGVVLNSGLADAPFSIQ